MSIIAKFGLDIRIIQRQTKTATSLSRLRNFRSCGSTVSDEIVLSNPSHRC
jgi:hypothetical protein